MLPLAARRCRGTGSVAARFAGVRRIAAAAGGLGDRGLRRRDGGMAPRRAAPRAPHLDRALVRLPRRVAARGASSGGDRRAVLIAAAGLPRPGAGAGGRGRCGSRRRGPFGSRPGRGRRATAARRFGSADYRRPGRCGRSWSRRCTRISARWRGRPLPGGLVYGDGDSETPPELGPARRG